MKLSYLIPLLLFVTIYFQTCSSQKYSCECKDSDGNIVTETGKYTGNSPDGYLIQVESSLKERKGYTSCDCQYD